MQDDFNALRAEIDAIDRTRADLFVRRMQLSEKIAAAKQQSGLPIIDTARERQILAAAKAAVPSNLSDDYVQLQREILRLSVRLQRRKTYSPSTLLVPARGGDYTVTVGAGILQQAGESFALNRRVLLLTDDNIPTSYVQTVAGQCKAPFVFTLPAGEQSKSFSALQKLLAEMQKLEFTKADCLIALGGGVVGDLGGLAAGLYKRGIDFYNIPTSLLAQVDAAVGGKTAIDFGGIKNAVGLIYPPKGVLVDTTLLHTLPDRQMRNGFAEVIKTAALFGETLFQKLENSITAEHLPDVITECLKAKIAVVSADEYECGLRRVLNFGHTVGHAVEAQTDLLHGEAVGIGMLPMCSPQVCRRLTAVLRQYNLPTCCTADRKALLHTALQDKKRGTDGICVVTVPKIGSYTFETIDETELARRIAAVAKGVN